MKNLNERVLELIKEIQKTFESDPEFAAEVIRDLTRVSKLLLEKELKKINDENKDA